ncbi:hypothetical protein CI109_103484 [Kwoniella shandongensis]|uniref:Iron-sulfur assembly protein 1 n=1 Tax=Kwoniella shandongensis TaxID=1734106 RepID=A0A5M6BW32_9TREE|nr:uncharacterized protein CI109_004613 [Kwoniella shandongensis]KAA5527078.1 hypothetical protein CI109_004613 [Kwoniella shandongensis]
MTLPAFRTSFASTSRLTLHHFTPTAIPFTRFGSSLAQATTSSFEGIPSQAYTGRVDTATKGKEGLHLAPPAQTVTATPTPALTSSGAKKTGEKRKVELKGKKNAIIMTPAAVSHLRNLLASPTEPRLLRISVKSRGCAGMAYHLDYVPPPGGRFDEVVEQDGVKVLIDSKALFSIIGSRMDWRDNRLSAGFVFDNPNVVDTCGCGESFNIRM